ncbi:MAG: type II toxin-antitoxin system HicA family toxin [Patescibacteria group bacterium]|nr:type II toxin-antitoxin system HicA family toxin [Patescibacteria group bacterium]
MKLPTISGQEILKILKKEGFVIISQKGSHIKVRKESPSDGKITVIVPNHKTLKRGTLKAILKQANITLDQPLKNLKKPLNSADLPID